MRNYPNFSMLTIVIPHGLFSLENVSVNKKYYINNVYRHLLNEIIAKVKKALKIISSCVPLLPDIHN